MRDFLISLHAVVLLRHLGGRAISTVLANNICVNPVQVRRALAPLVQAGILQITGGRGGGYQIDLHLGETAFKDSESVTVTGVDSTIQTIQAQRIVINTGATPRQLNIPGAIESQRVHYSTEVLELPQLPKRVLVVGSGFIGLEFAAYYAEFDQVLIAAGRVPNVAGLNLAAAGVELGQYGEIQVDEYLRTNVNNIWAAGDVKGEPQFTFISLDDSRIILPQLLNNAPSHTFRSGDGISARHLNNRPIFATCAFLNPPLARVGYTEKEATAKGLNFTVKKLATAAIPKAIPSPKPLAFLKY